MIEELIKFSNIIYSELGFADEKYEQLIKEKKFSLVITNENMNDIINYLSENKKENRFHKFAFASIVNHSNIQLLTKNYLIDFLLIFSKLSLNINNIDNAIKQSSKALHFIKQPCTEQIKAYSILATAYRNKGDYIEAFTYFQKSQTISLALNDNINNAWGFFHIGKMYLNYFRQPSKSISYLIKAKNEFSKIYYIKGIIACSDELGDVYRQINKNYEKAESYYNEALTLNISIDNKVGQARNLAHLGSCYFQYKKFDLAINYFTTSLKILKSIVGQEKAIGIRLIQLSQVYIQLDELIKAEEFLCEGLELCIKYKYFHYIAIGEYYYGIIFKKRQNYIIAIQHIQNSRKIADENKIYDIRKMTSGELGNLYSILEQYENAKEFYLESIQRNVENWQSIAKNSPTFEELGNQQELGEMYKDLFNNLLQDYIEEQKNIIQPITNVYEVILKHERNKYSNYTKLFRFGALMAGMRHEILNLINNINSSITRVLKINKINNETINLLNNIKELCINSTTLLYNQRIALLDKINENKDIIDSPQFNQIIQKLILGFKHFTIPITYYNDFPKSCFICDYETLYLIIHGITLNSCEAFSKVQDNSEIKIITKNTKQYFCITISDNAQGISKEILENVFQIGISPKKHNMGLGLSSIKYLVETYGGTIEIESEEGIGTVVTINFLISK
jgi:signal transduction histidine kinase/Tfp pilus assembly protein PilF